MQHKQCIMVKERKCFNSDCHRILSIEQNGDDFVIFQPCGCFACPKCSFRLCCNRKNETPLCECNSVVEEVIHFKPSRTNKHEGHLSLIEKFVVNIEKEPGRVFLKECQRDKETKKKLLNKMFLHLTYMDKKYDLNNKLILDRCRPATIVLILDLEHGF